MTTPELDPAVTPATEIYEIRLVENEATGWKYMRWLGVIVSNIIALGDGATSTGGRTVQVIERATGTVVHSFKEEMGDQSGGSVGYLRQEMAEHTAAEFATRWWKRADRPS